MNKPKDNVKLNTGADLRAMAEARLSGRTRPKSARDQLEEYKAVVKAGMRGFVEIGTALGLINKLKLYKEDGYSAFEAFVEAEFDLSRTSAYRLIEAARVVTQLSQVGTVSSRITNQAQALELAPLVGSVQAMANVVEAAGVGRLTAAALRAARERLHPETRVIDGEVVPDRLELEGTPQTAATEEGVPPVAAPTAVDDDASIGGVSADGDEGGPFVPDDSPAGDGPGYDGPVPGNPHDTPAAAVDDVALVAQQPGLHHPEPDPGGPVERGVAALAAPGIPSPSFEGSDNGDGEEGPDFPPGPSSDPAQLFVDFVDDFASKLRKVDIEAISPMLTDDELDRIDAAAAELTRSAQVLRFWNT